MKTYKLLNSAMMPQAGTYEMKEISFEEFKKIISDKSIEIDSYIGYPQNIQLIKNWTGREIELNRSQTKLEDGDEMLVMKLKYRVVNPSEKGKEVNEDDFEFFRIKYYDKKLIM